MVKGRGKGRETLGPRRLSSSCDQLISGPFSVAWPGSNLGGSTPRSRWWRISTFHGGPFTFWCGDSMILPRLACLPFIPSGTGAKTQLLSTFRTLLECNGPAPVGE